jgi:hypothetical protein
MSLLETIKKNKLSITALFVWSIWLGMDLADKGGCYCSESTPVAISVNADETNGPDNYLPTSTNTGEYLDEISDGLDSMFNVYQGCVNDYGVCADKHRSCSETLDDAVEIAKDNKEAYEECVEIARDNRDAANTLREIADEYKESLGYCQKTVEAYKRNLN